MSGSKYHSSWAEFLTPSAEKLLQELAHENLAPSVADVFRAFELPLKDVRVVIFGQDPYPTQGNANGLAFSVSPHTTKFPASLRNIFREYSDDLGFPIPTSGDLSRWCEQGVLLLNRTLTTEIGEPGAHADKGWRSITDKIAEELGRRSVIAILWGSHAQELAPFFRYRIEGVHPSPLSAYRGFFGSKPFSRVNSLLIERGEKPIDWKLK